MNLFKKKPIGTKTIQEGLPDSIHKDAAIALGKGLLEGDFYAFKKLLGENTKWIWPQTDRKSIVGKENIIDYWKDWRNRIRKERIEVEFEVKFCPYYAMATLNITPEGFASVYVLFYIKDGLIHTGIYAKTVVAHVNNSMKNFDAKYESLNNIPFTMEFVKKHITSPKEPQTNYMPCPHCGKVSENLIWKHVKFILGTNDYAGFVTICPDCNKVVLFYPECSNKRNDFFKDFDKKEEELLLTNFFTEIEQYFQQPLKGTKYIEDLSKANTESSKVSNGKIGYAQNETTSLYEIAANFDTRFLTIFYMRNYDKYEQVRNCYTAALADGIYESANNLGILTYSIEGFDKEKGIDYFKTALEHGSKAGYKNYIFACWHEEKYEQIKDLLASNDGFNPLANQGRQFQNLLKTGVFNCDNIEYTNILQEFLPEIQTERNWLLYMHIPSEEWFGGLGDQSRFFIADSKASSTNFDFNEQRIMFEGFMNFDIYEHIEIIKSEESIWQLYLLMNANSVLSFFWHGGYSQRTYIWSNSDFDNIEVLKNHDISSIVEKDFIKPTIEIKNTIEGFIAHVHCCYWNNWEGLVRDHVTMKVAKGRVTEYKNGENFIIYPYHCGIFY